MIDINKSPTLKQYKDTMKECLRLYYPGSLLKESELDYIVNTSIQNNFKDSEASLNNSYTKKEANMTLLQLSDWIAEKEPLCTALGTMFKSHEKSINPVFDVIQSFLDNRKAHKKMMFQYPKGSEDFAKYNLLQSLT